MAQARVDTNGLQVAEVLYRFVEDEALPGSGIDSDQFWSGAAALFATFRPPTEKALADRLATQHRIDAYHGSSSGPVDLSAYLDFLRSIGYLADVPADFAISTDGVDPEIAQLSGPQLVVPLLNARFAINAANARWGSLYDALYGTDVLPETDGRERGSGYNPRRGEDVIAYGRALLDEHLALAGASHADVDGYFVDDTGLGAISDGEVARLVDPSQFVGYSGSRAHPTSLLLAHHGLHVEIVVDRSDPVGATDRAGVKDLVLESALTVIMDLEDSVAAVDAADKVLGYRNWLQLMQGTLTAEVSKGDRTFTRRLMPDRTYQTLSGPTTRPGRSVMFVRQVGHLMSTDAVLDPDGPVPEGILDALMTALGSLADLREGSALRNSRTGSMYVVKPKMHGPDEVALACDILAAVEEVLNLPARTIKIGIMDEERRTSANLRASIHAARDRVAFINTGFLDRTGDEIHTSMVAGPMVRKEDMRSQPWIRAYEDGNVDAGLACGFSGRAQIGKGMWAAPESMADMVAQKGAHPRAGADCAWVPSPTAATLHAIHYHQIDVKARQEAIAGRPSAHLSDLLTPPVGDARAWSESDRAAELDNNVQGILGYVVRWVDAGIGCSKVPDISGVPLMEDRATCRISSQHIANWLRHGVVSPEQVVETLHRIAALVDQQNARVEGYRPMAPDFDGQAFLAAHDLIFEGAEQPNGYTEPILHRRRAAVKADRSTSPSQPQGSSSA